MPNNRTVQLLQPSLDGITFSVRSESAPELGRKLVLHEYINSDERFIEDQGQMPPKFNIQLFVHGVDFLRRADQLEAVLNREGFKRLVLPTFGAFKVQTGSYTKDASQKSVGEISYRVQFVTGRPAPGPSTSIADIQDVYEAGDTARKSIETIFQSQYVTPVTSTNAVAAEDDLTTIVNDISATISNVLPVDGLGRVINIVETVNLNASRLIRNPLNLAPLLLAGFPQAAGLWQQISLSFSQVQVLGVGLEQLLLLTNLGGGLTLSLNDINRSFSDSGQFSTVPLWPPTTQQRIDRNATRNNLVQANRVASLVGAYEIAAAKSYITDTEIVDTRTALEDIHERIMRIEPTSPDVLQFDPEIRSTVENVRLKSLDVMSQKEQETFEIVNDRVGMNTSSLVRSYALYAESLTNSEDLVNRAREIGNLNRAQSSLSLGKNFKILQVR